MNNAIEIIKPSAWWTAILFAAGVLLIGNIPSTLTFALDPNAVQRIGLESIPVPAWVFTGVWLIAYPCMGIATWLVWRKRYEANVSIPLVIFAAGLLQAQAFWLTNGLHMTAVIDALVLLIAYTVAYVYYQFDRRTLWWLLPWLLWMPTTFAIKLWTLSSGAR
jgi:translocator protein